MLDKYSRQLALRPLTTKMATAFVLSAVEETISQCITEFGAVQTKRDKGKEKKKSGDGDDDVPKKNKNTNDFDAIIARLSKRLAKVFRYALFNSLVTAPTAHYLFKCVDFTSLVSSAVTRGVFTATIGPVPRGLISSIGESAYSVISLVSRVSLTSVIVSPEQCLSVAMARIFRDGVSVNELFMVSPKYFYLAAGAAVEMWKAGLRVFPPVQLIVFSMVPKELWIPVLNFTALVWGIILNVASKKR